MWKCACMHVCSYTYTFIHACVHKHGHTKTHAQMWKCTCVCTHAVTRVHTHTHIYMHVPMNTYIYRQTHRDVNTHGNNETKIEKCSALFSVFQLLLLGLMLWIHSLVSLCLWWCSAPFKVTLFSFSLRLWLFSLLTVYGPPFIVTVVLCLKTGFFVSPF